MKQDTTQKKSVFKKFYSLIGNVFFVIGLIFIGLLLFSVVQSKVVGGPPTFLGHQMYIVLGGSMSPAFEVGSLAILEPVNPENVEVGDVITYHNKGLKGITTHRIVDVISENNQLSYKTRGDANDVDDPMLLESENIIGRVKITVPYVGRIMNFAQTKYGLLFIIIIPGLILIGFELYSLIKMILKSKEDKRIQSDTSSQIESS